MDQGGKISRAGFFYFSCLAFIAGIALASFFSFDPAHCLIYFGAAAGFFVLAAGAGKAARLRLPALLGLFLFLGIWRYLVFLPLESADKIWHYNGRALTVAGRLVLPVDAREASQKLTLGRIRLNGQALGGQLLLTVDRYPEYEYGDELEVSCQLRAPEPFDSFAYDRYLARHGIYSLCYYPAIKKGGNSGNAVFKRIYGFKDYAQKAFDRNLDPPYSALAAAMLLGNKQGIAPELRTIFARAGISHIIAISGMHIGIITAMILFVFRQLGCHRRLSYFSALGFLLLFIIMVGAPASAVRAGLMGFLVLTALHLGRLSRLKHSLCLAAALMLAFNPFLLRDDVGWQLSFLSVFGIACLYPLFERGWKRVLPRELADKKIAKSFLSLIAITLAANLATWPLVAYNFSIISLVSPLANLLVLWTLPFLFVLLIFGLLAGFLPALAWLALKIAQLFFFYIVEVSRLLAEAPLAYRETDAFGPLFIAFYYLLLLYVLRRARG